MERPSSPAPRTRIDVSGDMKCIYCFENKRNVNLANPSILLYIS